MVYLDFTKVFDKVDHGILLHKLDIWFFNFLSDRTQFVRIRGVSVLLPPLSVALLRGLLGPLIFLILMCDISNNVTSSSIVSFADDTRLYLDIKDVSDRNILQEDLNTVYGWATGNNMKYVAFSTTSILSDH